MGARSGGGSRGGGGGSTYSKLNSQQRQKVDAIMSSLGITDPHVKKDMMDALSKFELEYGIRQTDVKMANLSGAYGVNTISMLTGESRRILINAKSFSGEYKDVKNEYFKRNYSSGFKSVTSNPIGHTLVHEQAHSVWNKYLHTGAKAELIALFKKFKKDTSKTGHGTYAHTNTGEFFAETVTKGVLGKKDFYTEAVKGIVKKYKL